MRRTGAAAATCPIHAATNSVTSRVPTLRPTLSFGAGSGWWTWRRARERILRSIRSRVCAQAATDDVVHPHNFLGGTHLPAGCRESGLQPRRDLDFFLAQRKRQFHVVRYRLGCDLSDCLVVCVLGLQVWPGQSSDESGGSTHLYFPIVAAGGEFGKGSVQLRSRVGAVYRNYLAAQRRRHFFVGCAAGIPGAVAVGPAPDSGPHLSPDGCLQGLHTNEWSFKDCLPNRSLAVRGIWSWLNGGRDFPGVPDVSAVVDCDHCRRAALVSDLGTRGIAQTAGHAGHH